MPQGVNTKILLVTYLLGLGLLSTSCSTPAKGSAEGKPQWTPVDIAIARVSQLSQEPDYIGNTTPYQTVSLRAFSEGRLLGLKVDVGDTVTRGQILGQIDDTLLQTAVKQAQAELEVRQLEVTKARTQVNKAIVEVERCQLEKAQAQADDRHWQKLYQAGAVSQKSAEQANFKVQTVAHALEVATEAVRTQKQAVAAAQGRVIAQQATLAQAQERRAWSRLTSPISGVVIQKSTEPGNLLSPGSEVLKIADLSRVKVIVQVSELDLGKIQIGQSVPVHLDAFPDLPLIGRVTRISPAADTTSRLIPLEVVIPNTTGKIGSGLLARVNFATQPVPHIVVPQIAISTQPEANNGTIFILQNTGNQPKVTARAVTLGKRADGKVEILSGLQPGDRYVVRSGKPLKDGDRVRLSILDFGLGEKGS
jgi:RND family efflux transporter MFP subunit